MKSDSENSGTDCTVKLRRCGALSQPGIWAYSDYLHESRHSFTECVRFVMCQCRNICQFSVTEFKLPSLTDAVTPARQVLKLL